MLFEVGDLITVSYTSTIEPAKPQMCVCYNLISITGDNVYILMYETTHDFLKFFNMKLHDFVGMCDQFVQSQLLFDDKINVYKI